MSEIMLCEECSAKFRVVEQKMPFAGSSEDEPIKCPSCGWTTYARTNGVFRTILVKDE
jgi:predicted Zn finger-like uncharacterized protein